MQNLPVPRDRRVWREATALRDAGYEVAAISPADETGPGITVLDGIHLYRYRPARAGDGQVGHVVETGWAMACTARALWRIARDSGFDAVQVCNPPDTYVAFGRPLRMLGRAFVFDHHDLTPELYQSRFVRPRRTVLRLLLFLERRMLRTADAVVTTNTSMRAVALDRGGCTPSGVTVVRNGPEAATMRRTAAHPALREGRPYLACFVGCMGPQDGVELLVQAVHAYVHGRGRHDCTFALLGDGESLPAVTRLVSELGVQHHVRLVGWAEDPALFAYLSTADVGLCPEPPSVVNDRSSMIKTTEYMAFGLPVLSFDLPETRLSAGDSGHYVTAVDPAAYAEALASLLDDPSRRALMGAAGRRRVEDELSWERQVPAYVDVFDRLLGVGRTSGSTGVLASR